MNFLATELPGWIAAAGIIIGGVGLSLGLRWRGERDEAHRRIKRMLGEGYRELPPVPGKRGS